MGSPFPVPSDCTGVDAILCSTYEYYSVNKNESYEHINILTCNSFSGSNSFFELCEDNKHHIIIIGVLLYQTKESSNGNHT